MPRKFTEKKLLLASHNEGKLIEMRDLMAGHVDDVISAAHLHIEEPEETGTTYVENAILKAKHCMEHSGLPALADDSGLSVEALNGDPGVYSARWAGDPRDFNMAMQKVHNALGDSENRAAAFISVLALCWPDGHIETFQGRVEGDLCWPPRGDGGFGYDPIFVPQGHDKSFGELSFEIKQKMSHRANALHAMMKAIF